MLAGNRKSKYKQIMCLSERATKMRASLQLKHRHHLRRLTVILAPESCLIELVVPYRPITGKCLAAKIRSLRKPEPYKGKGIKFVGENIRRKAGKTAGAK